MMLTISSRSCKRYMLTEDRQQPLEYAIRRDLSFIPIQNLQLAGPSLDANCPRFGVAWVMMRRKPQTVLRHGHHPAFMAM
jgi:hypothetical protein